MPVQLREGMRTLPHMVTGFPPAHSIALSISSLFNKYQLVALTNQRRFYRVVGI